MSATLLEVPVVEQVAKVAVDIPLAHLDRLFDYRIPGKPLKDTRPGVRVTVPFAGQVVDGWLVSVGAPETGGKLVDLRSVISPKPILTTRLFDLIRAVADHYTGTWWDVARLATPLRHSRIEKQEQRTWPAPGPGGMPEILPGFPGGPELLTALTEGGAPRAFWQVPCVVGPPGDLTGGVLEAVLVSLASGREVLVLFPTIRGMEAGAARLERLLGQGCAARLSWELSRGLRYENYPVYPRGRARVVVGTQSAVFAPLLDPGLIVVVDDGNGGRCFKRFPRPHVRSITMIRAVQDGCVLLLAFHARSCEAQGLIERQWLRELALPSRETRRIGSAPRSVPETQQSNPGGTRLRFPRQAFEHLRIRLASGPVLVSVTRAGHSPGLRCVRCQARTTCPRYDGPLLRPSRDQLLCRLCGHIPVRFEYTRCHATGLRAPIAGSERAVEELGRAFPGVRVINSFAERIRSEIPEEPAIVVAVPDGEFGVPGDYAGVLILDAELTLSRASLRVGEKTLRCWCQVACLVRPAVDRGGLLIVGPPEEPAVQALPRADPGGFAARKLADRAAAGLPPAVRTVQVGDDPDVVAALLDNDPSTGAKVLGPTLTREDPDPEAVSLLHCPLEEGHELVRAVKHAAAIRSARKEGGRLFLQVDPMTLT